MNNLLTRPKGPGSTPTREEYQAYAQDPVAFSREVLKDVKSPDIQDHLKSMIALLEKQRDEEKTNELLPEENTAEHDLQVLQKLELIRKGPTRHMRAQWWLQTMLSACFSKLKMWNPIIAWLLQAIGYILVTGGGIYFVFFCSLGYGLGLQAFCGLVVFLILNYKLYLTEDEGGYDHRIRQNKRRLAIFAMISTIMITVFTFWKAVTPSIMFFDPKESVGVVRDWRENKVRSIVYPNGSSLAPDKNGDFLMDAPRIWRDEVVWYSLADKPLSTYFKDGDKTVEVDVSVGMSLRIRQGDTLNHLKTEGEYRNVMERAFPSIVKEAWKEGKLDADLARKMITEKLSNEIMTVSVGKEGFSVTEKKSYSTAEPIEASK